VLHSFQDNGKGGFYPAAGLIQDTTGNLYGTARFAGVYGGGTAFELIKQAGGGWSQKLLHFFGNNKDGVSPQANLVFDTSGNLYGTTYGGGPGGGGTVFNLSPQADGSWTEKILQGFNEDGIGGLNPCAALIFDAAGNLYGTTIRGGASYGTVFELTPTASGPWTHKILYIFGGGDDGSLPGGSLTFDSAGYLYGTTSSGGAGADGTVFQLQATSGGHWAEYVLHSFSTSDPAGQSPQGNVIFDPAGNLYGVTTGVYNSYGSVFELSPSGGGTWAANALHSFNDSDGAEPLAGIIRDAAGNLYGTTSDGGAYTLGTVFELSPTAGGGGTYIWTYSILHSFDTNGSDGYYPEASLVLDAAGNLYGTTAEGGPGYGGTIFEVKP